MRITVFGATGGTGKQLVQQGLDAGHQVTAVVRNRSKLTIEHPQLDVHTAGLDDPDALVPALEGRDVAFSAIGGQPPIAQLGTRTILRALEKTQVRRLLVISAAPVAPTPAEESLLFRTVVDPLVRFAFRKNYADLAEMERELRESHADWTVLRPPRLVNRPLTGTYRHKIGGSVVGSHSISRADLARAMLELVEDPSTTRQAVGVAAA